MYHSSGRCQSEFLIKKKPAFFNFLTTNSEQYNARLLEVVSFSFIFSHKVWRNVSEIIKKAYNYKKSSFALLT